MTETLPSGVQRVQNHLREQGSLSQVQMLPESTATSADAAQALGVSIANIGKSIVFRADFGVVVVILSGPLRVDSAKLANCLNLTKVGKMTAVEVKDETGFPIGGVSPFGLPSGIKIVIDGGLRALDPIWIAAGHPRAVVNVTFDQLMAIPGAATADVTV